MAWRGVEVSVVHSREDGPITYLRRVVSWMCKYGMRDAGVGTAVGRGRGG